MRIQHVNYTIEGSGKPIVLLHGFLENLTMWDEFSQQLQNNYTVIRIDLLGHGKTLSEGTEYTMEDQATLVNSVLEKENITDVVIAGHSMGGYITLAFAELFPEKVKGFSLFFSSATADSVEKKEQRTRAAELVKTQRKSFIHGAIPNLFHKPEKESLQPFVTQTRKMAEQVSSENIVATLYGMRSRKDRTQVLKSTIPKQLIIGAFDSALDLASLEEQIAKSHHLEHITFNVGHMGHYEAPKETFSALKGFIKKCFAE